MITDIKLICLIQGNKKGGNGVWYKATLKGYDSAKKAVSEAFYLSEEIGDKLIKDNIIDDVPVNVSLGFDDFFRPAITNISKRSTTNSNSSNKPEV